MIRRDHVRSLLSNRCFACHGPDEDEREGGFRLDDPKSPFAQAGLREDADRGWRSGAERIVATDVGRG